MTTETAPATTVAEVAHEIVEHCRQGTNMEAIRKYYASDVVSVESASGPTMPAETKGLDAVVGKSQWWVDNHEVHGATVEGPFLGDGDKFAVYFDYDITNKPTGQRMRMVEMGLYTVRNGKVVHEHFFYNAGA
jgi:ketosteroid isomerase-like protein